MKATTRLVLILIVSAMFTVSCKKDGNNPAVVEITQQSNGHTVDLSQGQTLKITLGNPGDGGYDFDTPQYQSSVLSLKSHTRNLPPANSPIGDFGSDTWEFSTLSQGSSVLTFTATRGSDKSSTVAIFTGTIAVK